MKVSFDIDDLLEELNDESTGTVISLIDEPDVLAYIVNRYVGQFWKDKKYVDSLVYYILNNYNADCATVETLAKCIKKKEISTLHAHRIVKHPNATENAKKMMEEFI